MIAVLNDPVSLIGGAFYREWRSEQIDRNQEASKFNLAHAISADTKPIN